MLKIQTKKQKEKSYASSKVAGMPLWAFVIIIIIVSLVLVGGIIGFVIYLRFENPIFGQEELKPAEEISNAPERINRSSSLYIRFENPIFDKKELKPAEEISNAPERINFDELNESQLKAILSRLSEHYKGFENFEIKKETMIEEVKEICDQFPKECFEIINQQP